MNDSVKGMGAVSLGAVGVGGGVQAGIDADRFARARDFVLCNARLIDRHLFACLFEGASNEPVRDALRAYRNLDGGPIGRCAVRVAERKQLSACALVGSAA